MPSVFSLSIPQLTRWSRRQKVDHRLQNEPVDAINRMMTGVAPPRISKQPIIPGTLIAQFRLKQSAADFADHIVCRAWDGTREGITDVRVAKPWLLQRTPFDQQVRNDVLYEYSNGITRTAYDNADETRELKREEQIHPQYLLDDVIIAARITTGMKIDGISVLWLDMNVDSRGWRTYYEWL